MKFRVLVPTIALSLMATSLFAQEHSDIDFGYDSQMNPMSLIIEGDEFTTDGILLFESAMEVLDPFNPDDFSSDEPGFATNPSDPLLVNEDDQIFLNILDASTASSFGVGYVNYYNPDTDSLEAQGRLGIYDNSASTMDLILNGGSIESGLNPQFLGLGDEDGDVHDHIIVDLLDDSSAPNGAYGVLFQLQSDFAAADGTMDLTSDPFWIVWNHGMDEEDFDSQALARFGFSSVPEPGSVSLLGLGFAAFLVRRRRS
jgi:hypothetical protein